MNRLLTVGERTWLEDLARVLREAPISVYSGGAIVDAV